MGQCEELLPVHSEDPCSQSGHRELPGEEVASPTTGAVGERTPVFLLFSWLHAVPPSRP